MYSQQLLDQLCTDEGFSKLPYKDTEGVLTCGYGYNLEENILNLSKEELNTIHSQGITKERAKELLIAACAISAVELQQYFPWFKTLNKVRQETLINMHYNLGINHLKEFHRMLQYLVKGNFVAASIEMLDSDWADQVGARAKTLALQMKTGAYAK